MDKAKRAQLAAAANKGGRCAISAGSSLRAVCAALQAIDPNGCHTAAAHRAEGLAPLSLDEAWAQLANLLGEA
jgi:hypothetical protein